MSNFGDLVNIEEFGEKRDTFNSERGEITFYCKECEKVVEVEREKPKAYVFSCKSCSGKNIAIGTEAGIQDNYFRKKF